MDTPDARHVSDFTALVERYMADKKLNRKGLGIASGLSNSYVSNVLNGIKVPNPGVVAAIASGLGMTVQDTVALHDAAARLAGYETGGETVTHVILINGPARSGKSTAAAAMEEHRGGTVIGFSHHLKRMVHCIYLGRNGALMDPECFDATKGYPQAILGGMSWRQAYIHYSENVIKPLHGKAWFGERFLDAVRAELVSTVYVPDSGFVEEAEAVVSALGAENVTLIRVHRPDCDFAGDSRSYIALDHLGVKTFEVHNNGTETQYRDKVLDVLTRVRR